MSESRLSTFGGRLAFGLAVLTALVLGAAVGAPVATVASLAGCLLLVGAATRSTGGTADRALASLLALLALLAAATVASLGLDAITLTVIALGAVAALGVGLDAATGFLATTDPDERGLTPALARSALALGAGTVPVAAAEGIFTTPLLPRIASAADPGSIPTFALLVLLQVLAVVVALLLRPALSLVTMWATGTRDVAAAADRLAALGASPSTGLGLYAGLLAVQAALVLVVPEELDAVLAALPFLGPALRTVLASGLLHVPLAALAVALVAILGLELLRHAVVVWAEPGPAGAFADAAGGIAGVLLAGLALPVAVALSRRTTAVDPLPGPSPTGVVALLLAGMIGLYVLAVGVWYAGHLRAVPDRVPGVALGAASLFGCAVVAAIGGVFPPIAFGAAAAAFVVWDLGNTAAELGATLEPDAPTGRGEFVRAAATALVGVGAAGIATVGLYVLGPVSASIPAWRGYLSMTLALLALSAFAVVLVRTR